jgi:hypothetical protein
MRAFVFHNWLNQASLQFGIGSLHLAQFFERGLRSLD